jgi:predicted negative regulator of RcsB-dependent stress response
VETNKKNLGGIMAKDRISRVRKRELEAPDEFLTFSRKLLQWILTHKMQMGFFVTVFFLIVIGLSAMTYYSKKTENKASLLVSKSIDKYHSALQDKGVENAFEDVEKEFEMIIEKYSGKDSGKFAQLFFANICYDAGKYEKAIEQYNMLLKNFKGEHAVRNLILSSLGYSYAQQKEYKTAATYFEMITSDSEGTNKDEAFFNSGILYAELGKDDESMAAFQKILDDYKESMYFELVTEKINESGNKRANRKVAD